MLIYETKSPEHIGKNTVNFDNLTIVTKEGFVNHTFSFTRKKGGWS